MRTIFTLALVIASSTMTFSANAIAPRPSNSGSTTHRSDVMKVEKAKPATTTDDASKYEIHDYMFEVIEPADQAETTGDKKEEIKATNKDTGSNYNYNSLEALKKSRRILEHKYNLYT